MAADDGTKEKLKRKILECILDYECKNPPSTSYSSNCNPQKIFEEILLQQQPVVPETLSLEFLIRRKCRYQPLTDKTKRDRLFQLLQSLNLKSVGMQDIHDKVILIKIPTITSSEDIQHQ